MGKPKVVAVSLIRHGNEDGTITEFDVEDELPSGTFSEDQLRAFIASGVAVDTSGELQEINASDADERTSKRDALLRSAGQPVLVSTANPQNQGNTPAPQIELEDENKKLKAELAELKAKGTPVSDKPIAGTKR